ncbi:metallophosphoesterase family protein [Isoptericola halotolerans]|uniref:Phosphodiesterase n=1 Tax=Isoptericola halotolerans TaxID=300560 RepID=A0ABX2A7Y3_9MICO|nr:metallophosphoesterase [Isoptericola halotolerans]NOV98980.1 putative phosphodiesterase [Isoptericola halotolerans]
MHDRPVPARWLRWTLAALAAVIACVGFGITTASATLSLGPHEAEYSVDTDGLVVVDLGPLGTLEIDSPLPLGLGVDVTVKEIPADLSAVGASSTLDRLVGDLDGYLQFYDSPQVTIDAVTVALLGDAARRAGLALVGVVLVGWGVRVLLGEARRRQLSASLAPRTWQLTAGVVIVAFVGTTLVSADVDGPRQGRPASAVFEGTALEGARITGRLAGVIDTYGGQLVALYDENEAFYEAARADLGQAWNSWEIRHAVRTNLGEEPPDPVSGEDGEGIVSMLVVADLHCNTGMSTVIEEAVQRSGADVVLNAGDTTMNGTAVEKVCVDAFASAVGDVPMVVADGNHDSVITSQQEAAHGQTILDGGTVEVAGVRILGDRDALETRIGEGTAVARERTPGEQAADLAAAACEQDPDLLLVHTPVVGLPALDAGCVPLQVSGHTHQRFGPVQVGRGIRYVSASTAGAASGQPTVGPLRGTAEMTLLRFDTTTREWLDVQVIAVTPSGEATVYDRERMPVVVPPVGELEDAVPPFSPPDGDEQDEEPAPSGSPSLDGPVAP